MSKNFSLVVVLFSAIALTYAQGDINAPEFNWNATPVFEIQERTAVDSLALWEEHVYLHVDKEKADAGEMIFFKAYVYNGPTQRRLSPSGVLRLELRDASNALVSTQYHPVAAGSGEGVLKLPEKLKDGQYELWAYTRWMKNYGQEQYYRKTIQVGDDPDLMDATENKGNYRLEFYPEGGRLLAGISNRLVLSSRSAQGAIGSVEGSIVDENGNTVADVQSYSRGYGMAIFQPQAGKVYSFKPSEGPVARLPEIQKEGYSLKVNSLSPEKIRIEVSATESLTGVPVVLEGKKDTQSYFIHVLELEDGMASLDISKASLPQGLMTFSLTGMDQVSWAERPVWIDTKEELVIQAEPLRNNLRKDGKMAYRIKVTDTEGNPVQTDLSAAVNSPSSISKSGIDQYLKPISIDADLTDSRSIRFLEDLKAQSLAEEAKERATPNEIRYPVERSLELHGAAYTLDNVLLANTDIQMMATSDSTLVIRELKTDAAGILHVEDLNVIGETQFVFRTKSEEQEGRLVKLRPITETLSRGKGATKTEAPSEAEVTESKILRKAQRKKEFVETTPPVAFDTTGVVQLKEVTVEDLRKREQELVPSLYGIRPNPNDVVYQDIKKPLPMDILLRKIPGVQITYTVEGLPQLYHLRRGGGSILWVVDGQVLRTQNDPYLSPLTFLTPLDILRMEFIIDAGQAAIFGVQAPTGVMIVYTRSGNMLDYVNRKEGGLYFKGYEPALDFDTYIAERQKNRKLRKTPSPTLYWNPSIQTDKNGEAVIEFSAPAEVKDAVLSVETLTPDGRVGSFRKAF
ncbi:Plug domain-containing protein [Robiginitalea aurantiaca]|uniref:Plug domain-containing protein n=1 Tax=Robiginitalea aurantiaca TaxID=3056915 RepID=A0ABT7WHT7_9FLAO|nr:Plug domain-containing protein [Robiginitalea aurantiaca]MDM9632481.1 Plug domain-containing protein [Robiginitalea aurantiaca]